MPTPQHGPIIELNDLPELENPVALHGARIGSGPCVGVNDDLWIIAVIMVYES